MYDDHQALVFIDGPHHQQERQQALDRAKTRQLEDAGYIVIRFPANQDAWPQVFDEFQDVFGRPIRSTDA